MASRLNVQQFVQRVAIGQPCRPLLIGAEEIARGVECHAHRETNTGAKRFSFLVVGRYFLNRAARALQAVARLAGRGIDEIGLQKVVGTQPEIDVSLRVQRHA